MTRIRWGSLGLALLIAAALVVWMASGDIKTARDKVEVQGQSSADTLPRVQVEVRDTVPYQPRLLVQGELRPWRSVQVAARVAGTVESIAAEEGARVDAGDVLLRISGDNRQADVDRARALVRKLEADLAAARQLRSSNLASQADILTLESDLAAARAQLQQAQLNLGYLSPRAPFAGTVNDRLVELGTLLQVGEPLMELVQTDRLRAVAQVPQQLVSSVAVGQSVRLDLLDGRQLDGQVSFIASAANPATRSFVTEIRVDNPSGERVAGGSATLGIALPEVDAMFFSPAYLSLGDDGRPGVLHVDENDRVVFSRVKLLNVTTEGAWVTGLPRQIRLITRGGGFVSVGQKVEPVISGDRD